MKHIHQSIATWPTGTFPADQDRTTDWHYSEAEAQGVCDLLMRNGAGGDRKVFPICAEVHPLERLAPSTGKQEGGV